MSPTSFYCFLMVSLTIIPIFFPSSYPTIVTNIPRAMNFFICSWRKYHIRIFFKPVSNMMICNSLFWFSFAVAAPWRPFVTARNNNHPFSKELLDSKSKSSIVIFHISFSYNSYNKNLIKNTATPVGLEPTIFPMGGLTILLWSHKRTGFKSPSRPTRVLSLLLGVLPSFFPPLGSNITFHQSPLSTKRGCFSFRLVLSR